MKTAFLTLLLLLSYGSVFAASEPGSYAFYQESVDNFCKPTAPNLWSDWKTYNLITIEQVHYSDITSKNSNDYYKNYLGTIKQDPSGIDLA